MSKTGDESSFADPLEGYVDIDGSVTYHLLEDQVEVVGMSPSSAEHDDSLFGMGLQGELVIPRITGIKTYTLTSNGACLGFQITYWDGSAYQTFEHASAGIGSSDGVTVTPNNFIDGSYIEGYRIWSDSSDPSAIAFEFAMSDQSTISCGSLDYSFFLGDDYYESGTDCSVIPIGFKSGWVESDPPYLVRLHPYITTIDSYSPAQITVFTTPLDADWKMLTLQTPSTQDLVLVENKQTFDGLETDLFASFDQSILPRMTGIQFYESEFEGYCMGF